MMTIAYVLNKTSEWRDGYPTKSVHHGAAAEEEKDPKALC